MKLADSPMTQLVTYKPDGFGKVQALAEADGVLFHCPLPSCGHMILCWFRGRVPDSAEPGPGRWDASGSGLHDLTLRPSVHLNGPGCGWHGWVTSGDAQ